MSASLRWVLAALVALIACAALGAVVAGRPPLPLDVEVADAWFGRATETAWWLTESGYGLMLGALGVLALGAAIVMRSGVVGVVLTLVAQVASQVTAAGLKIVFDRPRPPHWLVRHDAGLSYPSGHSVTAVVFFCGLAAVASGWRLPRPIRLALAFALSGWAIGIAWSRVALGAHNATDVVGGLLFGTAWFCVVQACERVFSARQAATRITP